MGNELKGTIAKKLDIRFQGGYELISGDKSTASAVEHLAREQGSRDPNNMFRLGRELSAAMPNAISIDNFLHYHSDDTHIVALGKTGIASSILEAERNSALFSDTHGSPIDFSKTQNRWLNAFCQILSEGVQKSGLDTIFDKVSIITFNYDRCIEHYIAQWLVSYARVNHETAYGLTGRLRIIHPYGQVGWLPWQSNPFRVPFGEDLWDEKLLAVSKRIRTFTEGVDDDDLINAMDEEISSAYRIVYLGFSYGEMNLELLKLKTDGVAKDVFGTAFGISAPNLGAIKSDVVRSLSSGRGSLINNINLERDLKCHGLLNDYWRILTS